jgi:Zn finger protein HypA/HybF involved in hydrogenase expression
MDDKTKDLELQVYCCQSCAKQFVYRELRCYSRYCPNCGNFMTHIDDTEQTPDDKTVLVVGGYF